MSLIDMSEIFQMTNVGDHIDGTDVYQSNRNLLDNWYFVGGGSQLGDGVFPINQRGQSSYASAGSCIDRWKTDGNFTISASGVSQDTTKAAFQMTTRDFFARLLGKTLTASLLLADGTIKSGTITMPASFGVTTSLTAVNDGSHYAGVLVYDAGNGQLFRFYGANIAAVKLELGSVSTLANDVPPNFGEELRKCQRYLRYVSLKRTPCYFDGTYSVAVLTLTGIEMAKSPTPSLIAAGFAWQPAAGASANLTAVSLITFEQYTPTIQFNLVTALSGMGMIYDTVIRLSCEL